MPHLIITSASIEADPPQPPSLWTRILTWLHLPGGTMANQPPTNVTAAWANMPAGGFPAGAQMLINVSATGVNSTAVPFTASIDVADDSVTPPVVTPVSLPGLLAQDNQLTASGTDSNGVTYTLQGVKQTGQAFTAQLVAAAPAAAVKVENAGGGEQVSALARWPRGHRAGRSR